MRIILVEDNETLAKGISYRMEDAGHSVDVLNDGSVADLYLKTDRGDVVILDINLPGMDGLAVLRNMRARGDKRPVIMLSARSDTRTRVAGLDMGADDYLVKPFDLRELVARITVHMKKHTSSQQVPACIDVSDARICLEKREFFL